jgi:DNA-binding transcriptional regulator YdaS (Cro superfamily)
MGQRTKKLLDALKAWCDEKYGRQTEVARVLGVTPQSLNDWFAGRKQLMGEHALAIQEFLRTHRRKKPAMDKSEG